MTIYSYTAKLAALSTFVATLMANPAVAYIGPGAGIGAIGALIAVVGAVILTIVGFVWYPVKRMLRKKKKKLSED